MRFRFAPVLVVLATLLLTGAAQAADTYKVDAVHSTLVFGIKHMDVSMFYGRFNGLAGTVTVDGDEVSKMKFDLSVPATKVDTGNTKRDEHLRGPEFFSVKEFPTITFKSTSVKSAGDNKLEVVGDLKLHGQTKSITVTLDKVGQGDTPQGAKIGFSGEFTIKRSEYGMDQVTGSVGDDVRIIVGLEAGK